MLLFDWWIELPLLVFMLLAIGFVMSIPHKRAPTEGEGRHYWPLRQKHIIAPSTANPPSCFLTLVIPAYNESKRIESMLKETIDYLRAIPNKRYEILVVDDGSKDNTTDVVSKWAVEQKVENLFVLKLEKNRGKGGAVTQGMLAANGEYIMFLDADGASNINDLSLLEEAALKATEAGSEVVSIGSRHHLVASDQVVQRSLLRNILMYSFHLIIYILGVRGVADTQCGFKLFSRRAAQLIFSNMHVEGWIFDIEVLLLAQSFNIPIVEKAIGWHEVEGSKMSLLKDSLRMLRDLLVIRTCYTLGIWKMVGSL